MLCNKKITLNNQYGVLHPEILSNFYYSDSTTPYIYPLKADVDQGGFLLPMMRPVFSGTQNYLPVELASINATRQQDNFVLITWKTANELNASRFEVFRGSNIVGSTAAKNDPNGSAYAVTDRSDSKFGAEYQLFETDRDGSDHQVGTVEVGPAAFGSLTLIASHYPNPVSRMMNIEASEPLVNVQLIDDLGRTVSEISPSSRTVAIDLSNVPNGAYTLWAIGTEKRETVKIMVAH